MIDTGKTYAILGLARSGIHAAIKLKGMGLRPYLSDIRKEADITEAVQLQKEFSCEFGGHTDRLLDYEVWIVSPGIPLDVPIIQKGREKGIKMISEIELGYQLKAGDSQIIAITGSNGKSTTASLVHHILVALGYKSILAGNIGDAFCSFPIEQKGTDYIVLEVSSFQLDLIESFAPKVSILLNLTPDHLNRYESFAAYCDSKMNIFKYQGAEDYAIIGIDSQEIAKRNDKIGSQVLSFSMLDEQADAYYNDGTIRLNGYSLDTKDLKLKGPHNFQNTMAALLVTKALRLDIKAAMEAAKGFNSLPHRLEYVETINGVSFYNDSKATNTDSVKSALASFERPIRIIMGGSDKGEDFALLVPELKQHALKAYICGDTKEAMKKAFEGHIPLALCEDLKSCVETALAESKEGDNVVLSPACASFDSFRNYEHRGEVFKEIVRGLK